MKKLLLAATALLLPTLLFAATTYHLSHSNFTCSDPKATPQIPELAIVDTNQVTLKTTKSWGTIQQVLSRNGNKLHAQKTANHPDMNVDATLTGTIVQPTKDTLNILPLQTQITTKQGSKVISIMQCSQNLYFTLNK